MAPVGRILLQFSGNGQTVNACANAKDIYDMKIDDGIKLYVLGSAYAGSDDVVDCV